MRIHYSFSLPVLLISLLVSFSEGQQRSEISYPLNGTWKPAREEMGGNEMPAAYYQSHVLVINDTTYTFTAESVDKGLITYADGKMDITGKEGINSGRSFKALYELKNDTLKICYNLKGDTYPASFVTKGNPLYFLVDFVRVGK